MTVVVLAAALVLSTTAQAPARDPGDVEARLRAARLELRAGHVDRAEAEFRAVLAEHPADVDARIGLGATLTRKGDWRDALEVLAAAEPDAGANADLFATFARAWRRAGDERRALEYYRRALALSPADPEVVDGYEAVARSYGHSLSVEGFGQRLDPDVDTTSGTVSASVRATSRLHVEGLLRTQQGSGVSDVIAGGGVLYRAGRATNVALRATGGSKNVSLPDADVGGEVLHYAGVFELGGGARALSFVNVGVIALSPIAAIDAGGRWRVDGRYTYSHSHFTASGKSRGDQSVLLRQTLRAWRRVWVNGSYAYGIESFEDLTADRLAHLGAHTAAGGVRIGLRSLTVVNATWEHQWRSNASRLDRLTVAVAQFFP